MMAQANLPINVLYQLFPDALKTITLLDGRIDWFFDIDCKYASLIHTNEEATSFLRLSYYRLGAKQEQ
jgi:hypothetical protein